MVLHDIKSLTVTSTTNTSGGAGGAGAAVDPPSFRFDSIENYQNLGWTANNSAAINNVILEFMEKFSAAVYRRLPANSPSFTGSDPKKIRLTSTARTFEKQASLMWDKIKNGGGDSAVYSLYGRKEWTEAVVNAYHAGNKDAAVAAVKKRVEVDGGGSAHLKGKGVDVHTWSHIDAEGGTSSGHYITFLNQMRGTPTLSLTRNSTAYGNINTGAGSDGLDAVNTNNRGTLLVIYTNGIPAQVGAEVTMKADAEL